MGLQAKVLLFVAGFFLKNSFFPKNMENGPIMDQNQAFLNLLETLVINFYWGWSIKKFALDQSDCSIFKLTISLNQNDERNWFFAYRCRFKKIKSWLKNIGVGLVKNGCGYSGLRTLKLAVSQEWINGANWFLVCW